MIKPPCRKCGKIEAVRIRYDIKADKSKQFFWFCESCQRLVIMEKGAFLGYDEVIPHVESLPSELQEKFWIERIRNDNSALAKCCVCHCEGAQLHHFAPQTLADYFGNEWHNWPTAYLCQDHHRQWHEIVTWYLPGYKQMQDEFLQKYYEAVGV
jgi:hypothetical protein